MTLGPSDIDLGGNSIHVSNIYTGATGLGQTGTLLDPTSAGTLSFTMTGLNFNATAPADIGHVTITLPSGYTRWLLNNIYVSNASHTMASASVGFYTAASQGGTNVVVAFTPTVTATADATNNNAQSCTIVDANTMSYLLANESAIYCNLATAEGAACTADVTVVVTPLP